MSNFHSARPTVLIVDDKPDNIDVLAEVLLPHYRTKGANSGERALQIANNHPDLDLILLDVMMPGMSGYQVCSQLKKNPLTRDIPVIFVTALQERVNEQQGFALGAVDYISKPVFPPLVLARVRAHMAERSQAKRLEQMVRELTGELETTRMQVIHTLARAAELRDDDTGSHVVRMSRYACLIAKSYGMSSDEVDLLLHAAPMHDVGKIGIPDQILLKPGPLDVSEFEIMRRHPLLGAEILGNESSTLMRAAHEVALTHHEKWDGSGYPYGLQAEDIPLRGRIVAIADVFDALTTQRPYKAAWTIERSMDHMEQAAGRHFDPELFEHFKRSLPGVLEIRQQYS